MTTQTNQSSDTRQPVPRLPGPKLPEPRLPKESYIVFAQLPAQPETPKATQTTDKDSPEQPAVLPAPKATTIPEKITPLKASPFILVANFKEIVEKTPTPTKAQFNKLGLSQKVLNDLQMDIDGALRNPRLSITKNGSPIRATEAQQMKIIWENVHFYKDLTSRLSYLGCFLPLDDNKQQFLNRFNSTYGNSSQEARQRVDDNLVDTFVKFAAKESPPLKFENWELREALMQHGFYRIAFEQCTKTSPKKLTKEDIKKSIWEFALEHKLEFGQRVREFTREGSAVRLSDTHTAWEIDNLTNRFLRTLAVNCALSNGNSKYITSRFPITEQNITSVKKQLAEIDNMCSKITYIDRTIRTAKLGDRHVTLLMGEQHYNAVQKCIGLCLMKTVIENDPLVYFPEGKPWEFSAHNPYEALTDGSILMYAPLLKALNVPTVATDLADTKGVDGKSPEGMRLRDSVIVSTICNYLHDAPLDKNSPKVAVGLFGSQHNVNFANSSQFWGDLRKECVPINVCLRRRDEDKFFATFDGNQDGPSIFKLATRDSEHRANTSFAIEIPRRLYSGETEAIAKAFHRDNNASSIDEKIRSASNFSDFDSKGDWEKTFNLLYTQEPATTPKDGSPR